MEKRYFLAIRSANTFLFEYGCYLYSTRITEDCVLRDFKRLEYHFNRFLNCNHDLLNALYIGVIFDNKYYCLTRFHIGLRSSLDNLFLDLDSYYKFPLPKSWRYKL